MSEKLHVIRPDGAYCGTFSWTTALELAGEGSCYAMDKNGLRVIVRDDSWVREPMPFGVLEWSDAFIDGMADE